MTAEEKFDHPCKQTCSGWRQGYERGLAEQAHELAKRNVDIAELREVLAREIPSYQQLLDGSRASIKSLIEERQFYRDALCGAESALASHGALYDGYDRAQIRAALRKSNE